MQVYGYQPLWNWCISTLYASEETARVRWISLNFLWVLLELMLWNRKFFRVINSGLWSGIFSAQMMQRFLKLLDLWKFLFGLWIYILLMLAFVRVTIEKNAVCYTKNKFPPLYVHCNLSKMWEIRLGICYNTWIS